jgi:hypothetical protein
VGKAHPECNGMGWIGEGSEATPCSCNPQRDGRPPEPARPDENPWVTVAVLDSDEVRDPKESGQTPQEAGFPASQIAAQNAADLARMAQEGKAKS